MPLSHTEQEMTEAQQVCANFDFTRTEDLARRIGTQRIIFTGMGSSVIFPGKHAKNRALQFNLQNRVESYLASDLFQYSDFSDTYVFLGSNSGNTKETILLHEHVKSRGAHSIAVTIAADSPLAQRAEGKLILTSGFEKGVAATKSVVEQALVYDSLIHHLAAQQGKEVNFTALKQELTQAGKAIEHNTNLTIDEDVMETLVNSEQYYLVGLDNGLAEEVALKFYEIARRVAIFYPDTHIVHGVAEAIEGNCALVFDPSAFKDYLSDVEEFQQKTRCQVIGVGSEDVLPGVKIKTNATFANYCLLAAGWGILREIAHRLNLDIDHPQKARKVGNPFQ